MSHLSLSLTGLGIFKPKSVRPLELLRLPKEKYLNDVYHFFLGLEAYMYIVHKSMFLHGIIYKSTSTSTNYLSLSHTS